jgi:hypothetical protein
MCLKIRCDGESEKFCKIFWKLNRALFQKENQENANPLEERFYRPFATEDEQWVDSHAI